MALHVTSHAVIRYQERVEAVDEATAYARLNCPAVIVAAEFGCCSVKLAHGQRVVLKGETVVTVLPGQRPTRRRYGRPQRDIEE